MTTARPSRDFRWTCRRKPWPQVEELPRPHKGEPYKGDEAIHYSARLNSTYQQRQFTRVVMDKHHKLIREAVTRMHEETHLSKHQYRVMDYYDKQRQIRDATDTHVPRTMKTGMSANALHGWQAGLEAHYQRKAQAVPTLNPWIGKHLQFKRDYCNKRRARARSRVKAAPEAPASKKSVDQLHAEIMAGWRPCRASAAPRSPRLHDPAASAPARRRLPGSARGARRAFPAIDDAARACVRATPRRSSTPAARRKREARFADAECPGEAPSAPATSTRGGQARRAASTATGTETTGLDQKTPAAASAAHDRVCRRHGSPPRRGRRPSRGCAAATGRRASARRAAAPRPTARARSRPCA